ncbi:MAG: tungsten formylmethanofuran dehydrogenase, partial [Calditrichaeota bacterium]|nr:tungsten formylmethanofuran dehydrogenase [Calditrichota bacterium]
RQGFAATPEPRPDVLLPFGRAAVRREGRDLTVVTWGMLVHRSLEAARVLAEEGVDLEVVDIRTINPLDFETIAASVRRTNRALVVHEDSLTAGFGAEIAARIADELFTVLDAPVRRVAALDTPIPFNPKLEARVLPQTADIVEAARELARF